MRGVDVFCGCCGDCCRHLIRQPTTGSFFKSTPIFGNPRATFRENFRKCCSGFVFLGEAFLADAVLSLSFYGVLWQPTLIFLVSAPIKHLRVPLLECSELEKKKRLGWFTHTGS